MGQSEVLKVMEKEKRIELEELNILCPVTRGALSSVVRNLIKQGHLKKESDPNNKSQKIIIYIK